VVVNKAVLNVAKGKALQVHCNVVTSNDRARRLYERHGFSVYGTEPRAESREFAAVDAPFSGGFSTAVWSTYIGTPRESSTIA
jgi:tRNA G18 (ribose-2'-O)-methylase SpoU